MRATAPSFTPAARGQNLGLGTRRGNGRCERGMLGGGWIRGAHLRAGHFVRTGPHDAIEDVAQAIEVADLHRHLAAHPVAGEALSLAVVVLRVDADVRSVDIAIGDLELARLREHGG